MHWKSTTTERAPAGIGIVAPTDGSPAEVCPASGVGGGIVIAGVDVGLVVAGVNAVARALVPLLAAQPANASAIGTIKQATSRVRPRG
ncbi:hypothetical protein GCM10023087_32130 [Microbacterium rhizosphaerae]